MPTTFHTTNWKNKIIDCLSGKSSTNTTTLEGGSANVKLYSGSQPADPSVAPSGTLLATITVAANAWGAPSAGIAVLANPIAGSGSANGTAAFARISDSAGNACIDTPVSLAGGGGGVILDNLSITNGGAIQITNMSVKAPASLGTIKLNMDLRNQLVTQWTDTAGASQLGVSGTISIYTGSQPAGADAPATGTKLVDIPTGGTSPWNTAVGGAASLASNLAANAVATGTAGYVRWTKGAYTLDGSVGTSATDFIIDSTSITNGNPVTLTEATISY
ncbi:MAG: hypothetical protein AB7N65_24845 [Vicinamibacterales bacterium]